MGQKGSNSWITWIGNETQPQLPEKVATVASSAFTFAEGTLTADEWKKRVTEAISRIDSNVADKVVLARDIVANSDSDIDTRTILKKLSNEYPSTWVFSVDGLVGATPELLLRLSRGMVTSRVLAGTIPKTGDDEKDLNRHPGIVVKPAENPWKGLAHGGGQWTVR